MGGQITVESDLGRGSTFTFTAQFGRPEDVSERCAPAALSDLREPPVPAAAPLRILVAEDDEFNSRHLERLLTWRGHHVQTAGNGRAALELLRIADRGLRTENEPSATPFDVLLLDLHMPVLDGFAVVRAIRDRESVAGGHLPVVALTARSRKEDRDRCLAVGMDEYLAKPVRSAELIATIERVMPTRRAPQVSPLDPDVLLAACGSDRNMLMELCQDLRSYVPGRLAEVRDALQDHDATRLREAAHKLCGLLSAFSTAAANAASQLEDRAASGQLDAARPMASQLEVMTDDLIRQLQGVSLESLHVASEVRSL
jgi:two-component system, sensor histidine kinase and response regulator